MRARQPQLPLSVEECAAHDARVTACFRRHDVDKSGFLDKAQLTAALRELGMAVHKPSDLEELINKVDRGDHHREGNLSLREFHSLFDATRLRRTFDEVDVRRNGVISADELVIALDRLGCREVSMQYAQRMLERLDKSHNGVVTWDEFYAVSATVRLEVGSMPMSRRSSSLCRWRQCKRSRSAGVSCYCRRTLIYQVARHLFRVT